MVLDVYEDNIGFAIGHVMCKSFPVVKRGDRAALICTFAPQEFELGNASPQNPFA